MAPCQARNRNTHAPVTEMPRAAVVLMAYGSPERLSDVPAYYADIRGGRPIRPELLDELVERYRRLGIEDGSPLNAITEQTRVELERALADVPVFTGMKHWTPRIAEASERALAAGAEVVVGLVLAPHYSRLSIGGYKEQLEAALDGRAHLAFVDSWHDDPGFLDVLAERVRGTDAHVVFTAHSLPERILTEGDPYKEQLLETAHLVADRAALTRWSFSFQSESRTGEPWLGPDILDHLDELHASGVCDVLVCPVGFVADHLEIRWDLDHEARERADALGMRFARIEMPNADPAFVRVLAGLVRRALAVPSEA
jgi:protoporphyrin/coproporphyrin ferrochelatase